MRNDFESNYLAHHGILGQKWGQKNGPPYPLGAGDHSAAERKAGWMKSLASKYEAHKKKRAKIKALKKARKTKIENAKKAEEQRKYEEAKQKALQSGKAEDVLKFKGDLTNKEYEEVKKRLDYEKDLEKRLDEKTDKEKTLRSGKASDVLKYKGQLTNDELRDAVQRLDWEKKLGDYSAKEIETNWDKMDKLMEKAKKVTDYAKTGVDAYKAIKDVMDLFNGEDKSNKKGGGSKSEKSNNSQKSEKKKEDKKKSSSKDPNDISFMDLFLNLGDNDVYNDYKAEKAEKRQKEIDDFYDDTPKKKESKSENKSSSKNDNSAFMNNPFVNLKEEADLDRIEELLEEYYRKQRK